MRTTRALIAGLGTTGSLVAGAACVFLVASAVIAFKGWPGAGFTNRIDSLFVNDRPSSAWDKPGTSAVAASAGAAAAAVAPTATGPTFGAAGVTLGGNGSARQGGTVRLPNGTLVSTGPNGPGIVSAVGGGTGTGGGGTSLPSIGPVNPSPAQSGVAGTVQQTGSTAGQTVRNTTSSVGSTVGGPVGSAVQQTGNTVGNTVENTTQAAGNLLHPGQ